MLLNFCLGCKKKKIASESDGLDDGVSMPDGCLPRGTENCKAANCKSTTKTSGKPAKTNSKSSNSKCSNSKSNGKTTDQVDSAAATSPSANCKYADKHVENGLPTPIHSVNNDGSVRIKANAINRALPDIPNGQGLNITANADTSSTTNAHNRSSDRPSLDRSFTPPSTSNLMPNLPSHSLNQSNHSAHSNSLSVNESTKFNNWASPSTFNPHNLPSLNSSLHSNSCLPDLDGGPADLNELHRSSKSEQRHHSYARIQNNEVIDSSTENDTDDYYDSTIVARRDLQKDRVTINVPSASNHLNLNSQINVAGQSNGQMAALNDPTSSLYAVSSNLATRTTNLELPYHISTINDVTSNSSFINSNFPSSSFNSSANAYDLSADEEPSKEVSYNKISVREPLAKVLADRAALMEHHYTEVYDENNSFYEEIAGSTNSSVTYTKIGDLTNNGQSQLAAGPSSSQIPPPTTSPPPIPVETSVLTIRSRSTSPMQTMPVLQTFLPSGNLLNVNLPGNLVGNLPGNLAGNQLPSSAFASTSSQQQQPINCEALYTQVNKLAKTNKKFLISPQPPNLNDLYAKVQKNLKLPSVDQERGRLLESGGISSRKIHSSTPDVQNASLSGMSLSGSVKERPPLPPPLDNIPKNPKSNHQFPIKSNTNLSHPEASTSYGNRQPFGLTVYPAHRRSLSSGGQYPDTDSDYYETCTNSKLPEDHNYERVKKTGDRSNDEEKEIVEAEYEIIKTPGAQANSDDDEDTGSPCYETIPSSKPTDEYISEPDYEVIPHDKNVGKALPPRASFSRLTRTESDASTDPGYERIRPDYDEKIVESNEVAYESRFVIRENFVERL